MNNYIRAFVIGSSLPVIISFYTAVGSMDRRVRNFSYRDYTFIAPLYLGVMNAISLWVGNRFNLSLRGRLLAISIISAIIVIAFARVTRSYNFNNWEWLKYYVKILIKHLITYNVIIYLLERSI